MTMTSHLTKTGAPPPSGASRLTPDRPTLGAVGPFVAVAMLGLVTAFLPPYAGSLWQVTCAGVVLVAAIAIEVVAIRRTERTWLDPVGPWLFFLAFVVLRDASGGSGSGLAPLVALPICWLVLFGTRLELFAAAVLTMAAFVVPLILLGEPAYPPSDWRRALLWSSFALLIAPMMQATAHELIRRRRDERRLAAELEGLMRSATLSSVIATDVEGTIVRFSPGAERLLGYRAADMVGLHDPGVFHDAAEVARVAQELEVPAGFATFAELARQDRPSRIWTYVRADGRRIFVRLAITELHDEDGALIGYLGVAIDSTAAVESERELARSEARWRRVMDRLADTTVLVLNEDLDIELVAGAGAVAVGIGGGAGHNLRDFSGPENLAVVSSLVAGALDGTDGRAELRSTVSGSEQDVYVTYLPGSSGEEPRALLLARDIGPERAKERELLRERSRAHGIFDHSPVGMALVDEHLTLVSANPALGAILAVPVADLPGRPVTSVTRWHDALSEHLRRHRERPWLTHQSEVDLPTEHGERHFALVTVSLGGGTATAGSGRTDTTAASTEILLQVQDVTEHRQHAASLSHLADHDPLTGLGNRRRLSRELGAHLHGTSGAMGALVVVDLDHFKEVNDTLGHAAGDSLLVSVAEALRQSVRSTDLVARLGGDEFAIILSDADEDGVRRACDAIVEAVAEVTRSMPGTAAGVTATVGAVLITDQASTPEALFVAADSAMYEAKERGRNHWALRRSDGTRSRRRTRRADGPARLGDRLDP